MTPRGWGPPSGGLAAFLYAALSLALTWPLVLGLGRDVPGDLGDSLLNMWILAWGAEHVPRLVTGAIGWSEFWNANIFHPEPLSLALSEHLFAQVLQILPIYWLTGNIILCYNLLFISTFGLSAVGTFLLVRDLTGSPRAAFVAGLVYGFLPYRIASVPHLQVLSSQWMPFALYGLNRFITNGSFRALAGGSGALVIQNWSCGYYLLYFAPFVPLFLLHRMWTLGTPGTPGTPSTPGTLRTWAGLIAAALGTFVLTLPFLWPYVQAQEQFGIERLFGEVMTFSANAWGYATASENLRLWGGVLRAYPRPEGETFLGFVPWLLAIVALGALVFRHAEVSGSSRRGQPRWLRLLRWTLIVAAVTQFIALASVVTFGGFDFSVAGIPIRARTPVRLLMQFVAAAGMLLAFSPRLRLEGARVIRSPILFFFAATVFAMWLSLGPAPRAGDSLVSGFGVYGVLYDNVPGFNGVRVPARYAMIAGLFLAVLAGFGAATVTGGSESVSPTPAQVAGGRRRIALVVLAALILAEGAAVPMERNRTWALNEAEPPARVFPATGLARRSLGEGGAPPVYARLAALPAGSAITEFPFGDAAWEIRYVYYSAAHWMPITNGYSGGFPPRYKERVARLQRVDANPEASWQALKGTGTTHVVLHRNAFRNRADADTVESWLESHGATEVERFADGDVLFNLTTNNTK